MFSLFGSQARVGGEGAIVGEPSRSNVPILGRKESQTRNPNGPKLPGRSHKGFESLVDSATEGSQVGSPFMKETTQIPSAPVQEFCVVEA